jgi:hypothetical protein
MEFIEKIILGLLGGDQIERNLLRCQNYYANSIVSWKRQTDLNWFQALKILRAIDIFDSIRIRETIQHIVTQNEELFSRPNLYITSFGSEGKSGGKIAYEFRHSGSVDERIFVKSYELSKLPESSTIIFVEDLIGTGTQSTEYILNKLNLLINPSSEPYLLTICATPEGVNRVLDETNFKSINGILLEESTYQYYSDQCNYFSNKEKKKIMDLNSRLKTPSKMDYDRGLLVTFFYSPPNNSMPIIWKHDFPYKDKNGSSRKWNAILPRKY